MGLESTIRHGGRVSLELAKVTIGVENTRVSAGVNVFVISK